MKRIKYLLLLLSLFFTTAAFSQQKQKKVTLSLKNVTVNAALNALKAQTGLSYWFDAKNVDLQKVVSVKVKSASIKDALKSILRGQKVQYQIKDGHIVIYKVDKGMNQQIVKHENLHKVTGKVTDSQGRTLPGVSVVIKGTTTGTITDMNGNFTFQDVSSNATLVFSFVGMKSAEIAVGDQSVINVSLSESSTALNEVEVIGYGTVKKQDATGSVATVSSSDFNPAVVNSPEQLISGKVAGVVVTSNSGAPGVSSTIRIQGGSSLYASNDPLYVIDGVPIESTTAAGSPGPLSTLNPNDIQSVTILKGASATAIYGSRASGGVILITTKKGGKKFTVSYNVNVSVATLPKTLNVLSANELRTAVKKYFPNSVDLLGTDPSINTNWQKQIFQTAIGQDHNVSISGTTGKLPYRVSLGYNNTDGILKTYNYKRTTMDVNLDPSLLKNRLKVHVHLSGSDNGNNFADQSAIANAVAMDPTKPVYNNNTRWRGYFTWTQNANADINGPAVALATPNPVAKLNLTDNTSTYLRTIDNLTLDYSVPFITGLHAHLNFGYDYGESTGHNNVMDSTAWTNAATVAGGQYSPYHQTNLNTTFEFYLNYNKYVNSIQSDFSLMGGYSYAHSRSEIIDSTMNAAKTVYSAVANISPTLYNLVSFYGRLNYTLKNRYLLTFTLRDDGTSRFGPGNKWGLFPALAAAWKINDEPFLKGHKNISLLKLRVGYGVTGQQQINEGNFPYLGTYMFGDTFTQYGLGNQFVTTVRPNPYDANIKWESTKDFNIGIDFGFFNNRLNGSIEYFNKITDNLISQVPPPAGTNFTNSLLSNVGNLSNSGFDFSIDGVIVQNKNWYWELDYNFSYDKVLITKLTENNIANYSIPQGFIQGSTNDYAQAFMVGQAPYVFYVYQQVYDKKGNPVEGVYVDRNHDGVINSSDLYPYKSPTPDVVMGISSTVKYKKWTFSFDGRVSLGNYVFNNIAANSTWNTVLHNADYLQNVTTQVYKTNFLYQNYHSDFYIQNASYFRMDNINLTYDFGKIIDNAVDLSANLTCQNAFTITPYQGLDPEINGGIDNNFFPRARTFVLGVNLHF